MSILHALFRSSEAIPADPIDHPDLIRMSPRELADLPFPRLGQNPPAGTQRGDQARTVAAFPPWQQSRRG